MTVHDLTEKLVERVVADAVEEEGWRPSHSARIYVRSCYEATMDDAIEAQAKADRLCGSDVYDPVTDDRYAARRRHFARARATEAWDEFARWHRTVWFLDWDASERARRGEK